jgi:transposase
MSLHPAPIPAIPAETARIARAVFPQGNLYMQLKDELGSVYKDEAFAHLFPQRGQPAVAPWQLALITLMQYMESLSDRQAADAVRSRIDWKYALSLELTDPGFDHSVLSEFRSRLIAGSAEELLLDILLEKCKDRKWVKAKGRQRTDSTHVLGWARVINRMVCVGETMRAALNTLAVVAPDWLQKNSSPKWLERYGKRVEDFWLPKSKDKRDEYARQVGMDGHQLLSAIYESDTPEWLGRIPAVDTLRQVWLQQYLVESNQIHWRSEKEGLPTATHLISSPYDIQARFAKKHTTIWLGYKVHLTETCDDDLPNLITNVATTAAPVHDTDVVEPVYTVLKTKDLLPLTHIADTNYIDAELLNTSQQDYGVNLLGPTRQDNKWQAQAKQGFAAECFQVDWQKQQATCPEGKTSSSWSPAKNVYGQETVKIKFAQKDCIACPSWANCTTAARRTITLRKEEHHLALIAARAREKSPQYKAEYNKRAGIEGTISQGIRGFGLRKARYVGLAKTHLQHVLTATAINFARISNWLADIPREKTRTSAFQKLMQSVVAVS